MHFDELVLQIPGEVVRVGFHPRMTVLSGLDAPDRQELSDLILEALDGGGPNAGMRYTDGTGRSVTLSIGPEQGGPRYDDDGSAAGPPIGRAGGPPISARSLVLVRATDLDVPLSCGTDDEPVELTETREALRALAEQLEEAREHESLTASARQEVEALEDQIVAARDGQARRQYAETLARLERVRAEAAVLGTGSAGADSDQRLIAHVAQVNEQALRWRATHERRQEVATPFGNRARLAPEELAAATNIPADPPPDLSTHLHEVLAAEEAHKELTERLAVVAKAGLPEPSDPIVAELGLLDQRALAATAKQLLAADDNLQRAQVSTGGPEGSGAEPLPGAIADMETAHRALEEEERAAEAVRVPGVAGSGLGVAIALAGTIDHVLLIPLGLIIAVLVGNLTLIKPRRRVAEAEEAERAALERAGTPSYLGFHLRRVDASMDPEVVAAVEQARATHQAALAEWQHLVGPDVDVHRAKVHAAEILAYNQAVSGGTAHELAALREDLANRVEPAALAAWESLLALCAPYGISADDLPEAHAAEAGITAAVNKGRVARHQVQLEAAEDEEAQAARPLDEQLTALGFTGEDLAARIGAFAWAIKRAQDREEARASSRPSSEIDRDLASLETEADRLRRPEWAEVTAAEAAGPDVAELEERREKLLARIAEQSASGDVAQLADRHAALERRVSSLEVAHHQRAAVDDPTAVAELQQRLLGHLTKTAQAGPHGDSVPVVLDDVFRRVPAERTWDMLDLVHRISERHQVVYLSGDPFVAAWARQCPSGTVTLLEPDPV